MTAMVISVVITTMNRPVEFRVALKSVLSQSYEHKQIVAVVDGSKDTLKNYAKVIEEFEEQVDFVFLGDKKNGHGPSYSRNIGIEQSYGQYIAFLDDDDIWNDEEHLARFAGIVKELNCALPELYFTHQQAKYPDGKLHKNAIWLEDLIDKINFDASGVSRIAFDKLLFSKGFGHVNCTIALRTLVQDINGFDEALRYEEDRDFYYRLLDKASRIFISKYYIGIHFIPTGRSSASNLNNSLFRCTQQLQSALKLISTLKRKKIIAKVEKSAAYTAQNLANIHYAKNDMRRAERFVLLSLALKFTLGALKALARILIYKKTKNE